MFQVLNCDIEEVPGIYEETHVQVVNWESEDLLTTYGQIYMTVLSSIYLYSLSCSVEILEIHIISYLYIDVRQQETVFSLFSCIDYTTVWFSFDKKVNCF